MRELHSVLSPQSLLVGGVYTSTPTVGIADIKGFDALYIMIHIGIGGITFTVTNRIEFKMEHSDDAITWADVTQADVRNVTLQAGAMVRRLITPKGFVDVQEVSYVGTRRYVRVTPTFSGTHGTGTPLSMTALRGYPHVAPVV
jgi:hypothetical protein